MSARSETPPVAAPSATHAARPSPVQRIGALVLGALDAAIGAASKLPAPPVRRRAQAPDDTSPRPADLGLGLKIMVGAIVGTIAVGVVGPIVLAVVVGLAGGH